MADISYSINAVGKTVAFWANTPKGEAFLGRPTRVLPLADAQAYIELARKAGLIVAAFPLDQ